MKTVRKFIPGRKNFLHQQADSVAPTKLARHGIAEWKAIETCEFLRRASLYYRAALSAKVYA